MKRNGNDSNLTIGQLREKLRGRNRDLYTIGQRMARYGANILGSPSYFLLRKKESLSLIEMKGTPTSWFTLSLPNWYWDELGGIAGPDVDLKSWFLNNPHIVNEYFIRRAEAFFDVYFGNGGMQRTWIWYRFEFQMRGKVHLHGMLRLKDDPGLAGLGSEVISGRKALHKLIMIRDEKYNCNEEFKEEILQLPRSTECKDQLCQETLLKEIQQQLTEDREVNMDYIARLLKSYKSGKEAERRLKKFRDFF